MERYIGGEFWYDNKILYQVKQIEIGKAYFMSGGRASLQIICDYLKSIGINEILLPEYICPTVLDCFDYNNIKYDFYRISMHFKIDLDDLHIKSKEKDAILFITFFGFSFSPGELSFISNLKKAGKLIIEDNVQLAFNKNRIGNLSFNSFRKFVPYDGSFLYSDFPLDEFVKKHILGKNTRIPMIRDAREYKKRFIFNGIGEEAEALKKFKDAEVAYYNDTCPVGDIDEKVSIEKLDWNTIIAKRRENYCYAVKQIISIKNVELINNKLNTDDIPIGIPFYIKNRDNIRNGLRRKNIFLPVHWDFKNDMRYTKNSIEQSKDILTFVIDQRYGEEEIEYIVESIKQLNH